MKTREKIGAIYGRYSTHEQDTGSSKESQLKRAREKAREMDIIIPENLIFFDEARTGTKDTRPEFVRMIEAAESSPCPFTFLFCEDTSRFARNSLHAKLYKQKLKKRGIQIVYTAHSFGEDIEGEFVEGIMEQIDEFQSKQVRRKTIHHMIDNLQAGFSNGGCAPLGLKRKKILVDKEKDRVRVRWIPDPDTAPIVRKCFEMRADGYAPAAIVRAMSWYTKPSGAKITAGDLYYWFRRLADVYAGRLVWNKSTNRGRTFLPEEEWVVIPNALEAIVPPAVADKVKALYKDRIAPVRRYRKGQTRLYYGTSLIECGHCGRHMNADKSGQRNSSYYVCYGFRRLKTCDHSRHYRVNLIDQGILDALSRRVFTVKNAEKWVDTILEYVEGVEVGNTHREEGEILKLKKESSTRLERLKEAIASGSIPYEVLADKIMEENSRLAQIDSDLEFLRSLKTTNIYRPSRAAIRATVDSFRTILDESAPVEVKNLVNEVIKKIVVTSDGQVKITYDRNVLVKGLDLPQEIIYNLGDLKKVRNGQDAGPRLRARTEHLTEISFF